MLMFHNCSRYKAGLLQKGCIFLYFQIKTNSLKLDAVTKKCLLNCSPFWTDSLWEQRHLKAQLFSFESIKLSNTPEYDAPQALQDPPFCRSTEKEYPMLSTWVIYFSGVSTEYPIHFSPLQTAPGPPSKKGISLMTGPVYRIYQELLPCSIKQQECSRIQ
jgi:hypothetical protein